MNKLAYIPKNMEIALGTIVKLSNKEVGIYTITLDLDGTIRKEIQTINNQYYITDELLDSDVEVIVMDVKLKGVFTYE